MAYQIFTRTSHAGGRPTPGNRPRRVTVVSTIDEAVRYCTARNGARNSRQIRDGFHHEFTTTDYYREAWGR